MEKSEWNFFVLILLGNMNRELIIFHYSLIPLALSIAFYLMMLWGIIKFLIAFAIKHTDLQNFFVATYFLSLSFFFFFQLPRNNLSRKMLCLQRSKASQKVNSGPLGGAGFHFLITRIGQRKERHNWAWGCRACLKAQASKAFFKQFYCLKA